MHKYKTLFGYEFRRMWWALILGGLMALVGVLYLGMQVSMRGANCRYVPGWTFPQSGRVL